MAKDKENQKKQSTAVDGNSDNLDNPKKAKKFYPFKKDIKFLEAVDHIIERNLRARIKPRTDSALAKIIYPPNRSIISAVRSSTKHIPETALVNLALMFSIDFNFFWRDDAPLIYSSDKEDYSDTYTVGTNKFSITEEEPRTRFEADKKILDIHFLDAENAINSLPAEVPAVSIQACLKPLSNIQIKARQIQEQLAEEVAQKKKELEELSASFEQQLEEERRKTKKMEKELVKLRKSERGYLEKYLKLLEETNK